MRRFTPAFSVSVLLLLVMRGAYAQTEPNAGEPRSPQRQANSTDIESRSATRIRGKVVSDDGRTIPDASITIFPVNVAGNMQGAVTSLLRPVTSDAEGNFELTSLRPGAYTLSVSSPGYVSSEQDSKMFYRPGDSATLTLVKGGVITGKVTNSAGDPVVGATVRAIKIREADEKPARVRGNIASQVSENMAMLFGPFKTDDRGIYRIYGLTRGYYQVAAGGRGAQGFSLGATSSYDSEAPTYYPSSTIETAAEVTVVAGEEATNIDIRYRENRGHSIGGTVTVPAGPQPQAISVILARANNGVVEGSTVVLAGRNHFGFDTLVDGDYVVTAMASSGNQALEPSLEGLSASASQSQSLTIRGADVTGINLILEPLASIAGRAVLEPLRNAKQKAACKDLRSVPIEGTVLSARDERKHTAVDPGGALLGGFKYTTPNEKGDFMINLLRPGIHHLEVQLPADNLYLKAITIPHTDANYKPIDAAKSGVKLASGDKITGLVVTLTQGAAGFAGKVVIGADNKPPAARMRVHLVPAEPESGDDVLRYFEAEVAADGRFSLANLAPGKYWIVGLDTEEKPVEADHTPAAFDPSARTALRVEGEASKKQIDLGPCQFMGDYELRYVPRTRPSKPPTKAPQ